MSERSPRSLAEVARPAAAPKTKLTHHFHICAEPLEYADVFLEHPKSSALRRASTRMPFLGHEPALLQLLNRARDDACAELRANGGDDSHVPRLMMSVRLTTAIAAGERDPERLKVLALKAVDGPAPDDPGGS